MMNGFLTALGVFLLVIGIMGSIYNAPQLKRMVDLKNKFNTENSKHPGKENISGHLVEYHASMLAVSILLMATGSYLVFIR